MGDPSPDVVVIGAGIVGAASAHACAAAGLRVAVVERGTIAAGTTSAGEGNILVSDKGPGPELDLALLSARLWLRIRDDLGGDTFEYEEKGGVVVARTAAIGTSSGPDEIYFKNGFQPYQDVYDFHIYEDPKAVANAFDSYRKLFAKYPGSAKPIWSTETGLNSQGMTRRVIVAALPVAEAMFPLDQLTDRSDAFRIAETVFASPAGERAS